MFVGLSKLEYLYIHQNRIQLISSNAFIELRKLERLSMWSNVIQHISRDVLQPLTKLKELRMDNNRLVCNCDLLLVLHEYSERHQHQPAVATCYEPENFKGRMISTLRLEEFNCSYEHKNEIAEDVISAVGEQISLRCTVKGLARQDIVWRKDGFEIPTDGRFTVTSDGTLDINSVSQEDSGTYECKVSNGFGESAMKVRLNLVENEVRPRFTHRSGNTEAISGNAVRLLCRVSGFPRPRVTWRKDGNSLRPNRRLKLLANGDLEIMPVVQDDNGYYTCEARNPIGIISHTARIIVKARPIFLKSPRNVHALDGETVTLECRARGYPQPAIAWNKNGDRLPSDGRHIVLPSGTLRILYVNKQNEGTYHCQAVNVIGVNSTSARVTVSNRVPPRIHSKPDDATVRAGNTIFFQCAASGAPKPVISWIKDGVQVSSGNRYSVNSSTGVLEIRDIGKEDEGRWECAARNSIGFSSEVFELRVIGLRDGNYQGDEFVKNSVERARIEIDRAIDETKQKLTTFVPRTAGDLLALFRFPSPEAVRLGRAAEIFETALNFIQEQVDFKNFDIGKEEDLHSNLNNLVSPEQVAMLANLSGCTAHQNEANCSDLCFHMKFRSYDGSCNNLKHPMWGAALTPFGRLLSPIYENGFNTPVAWNNTEGKPSARLISMEVMSTLNTTNDTELTHMAMQWGQFIDHDFTFQVTSPNTARFTDGGRCDVSCEKEHPCFPIEIPRNDPRSKRHKCMDFTRSSSVCGSGSTSVFFDVITPRQQINQITSYIDASNVYGSTKHESMELRDLSSNWGLLKTGSLAPSGKPYLPYNTDLPVDCQVNRSETTIPCFLAGDHRANEQLGLLSMHTLWMREHNRIATELRRINPHWKGDEIYHNARKIVGAQMQHITFKWWLPKILGKEGMERIGNYERYDPTVDSSVLNSFATAAFRFGHSLIQPFLTRFNASFMPTEEGHLPLHKAFFSPNRLLSEGGIDPLIRGLFVTAAKERRDTDQVMNTELTNRLFQMAHDIALDLAALNIQRGRDHALPGYNNWREYCNLPLAATFDDLSKEIPSEEIREKLKRLYIHPDNIDLFVGGMVEDVIPGTRLGPVFMCLITTQFKRIRNGDRFWYENPGVFEPAQLTQIKQSSLSRVICDNSDNIRHVQKDVFKVIQSHAEYLPCERIPILDLSFWKACCDDKDSCTNRDSSFTISNFLRNNENHQRSKRSINLDAEMPKTEKNVTDENPGNKEGREEQEPEIHEEEEHPLEQSSLQGRVDRLENVVLEIAASLSNIQNELKGMKKTLEDVTKKKHKHCKDKNGLKRKNNEVWKAKDGKHCICHDGKTRCKG
ncbi:peroxidasin homolog isoform X2 [Rhopilema esculentum]